MDQPQLTTGTEFGQDKEFTKGKKKCSNARGRGKDTRQSRSNGWGSFLVGYFAPQRENENFTIKVEATEARMSDHY